MSDVGTGDPNVPFLDAMRTLDRDPQMELMAGWMGDVEVLKPFGERWEAAIRDQEPAK